MAKIQGESAPALTEPADTQASAARARLIVMALEKGWGYSPVDRELEKLGYDIESIDAQNSKDRLVTQFGKSPCVDDAAGWLRVRPRVVDAVLKYTSK